MAQSGAGWIRVHFRRGPYSGDTAQFYAKYDEIVDRLRARGLQVVGLERGIKRDTNPDFAVPQIRDELRYFQRTELMMDTARDAAWIESELVATVTKKVQVGERYDRTRPLWLVVRNPYTHLPSVSDATRGQLSAVNGDMFRRVYVFNRKASDPIDGNTPQPIVLTALALDRRAR